MIHKILYTSDIHGNEIQYSKFLEYAIKISADSIIIGGDLAPKNYSKNNFIKGQKSFLKTKLPELLVPFKKFLPNSKIFLMMGNDDCAINLDTLKIKEPNLYHIIHGKRLKITENFEIVGYSYVPITPFGIKDWEKYDLSNVPPDLKNEYITRKRTNYKLNGFKSSAKGWNEFQFTPNIEQSDSIQKDLSDKLFTEKPIKTIYVFHTPPNKTNLDQIMNGHVGSMAVRCFIEKYQPYLTLHGHIHETVNISGDFKHKINNTLCLSSGNHNIGEHLAVLVLDLYKPEEVKRVIL